MSDMFEVSIPWGVNAVSKMATDGPMEVEQLLLQQSIIDELQQEKKTLEIQKEALRKQGADMDMELYARQARIEHLEGELDAARKTLTEKADISADEVDKLRAKITELEALLDSALYSKNQAIARNNDQERKLTAVQFQHDQVQKLLDEKRLAVNRYHAENAAQAAELDTLRCESADNQKYIKRLEDELAGVPVRIDNAVATALAGRSEVNHGEVTALRDEVARLAGELIQMTEQRDRLEAENASIHQQNAELIEIAKLGNQAVDTAFERWEKERSKHDRYKREAKEIIELVAGQHQELAKFKKDCLILAKAVECLQGGKIYHGDDGTMVFMLHNDIYTKVDQLGQQDGDDNAAPHPDYPLCWAVKPNGTGHLLMLSKSMENLVFPGKLDGDCLMDASHNDAVEEAIKSRPTMPEVEEAFQKSMETIGNVSVNAELLDYDFAKTHETVELIQAMIKAGWSAEELEERKQGIALLQSLNAQYRSRRSGLEMRKRASDVCRANKAKRSKKKKR